MKHWNEIQFLTKIGVQNSLQVLDLLRSIKLHVLTYLLHFPFDEGK